MANAADITLGEPPTDEDNEMANKRRRRPGGGKKPLKEGEDTARPTVNLPESLYDRALRKAGPKGFSAYARHLIEKDLKAS